MRQMIIPCIKDRIWLIRYNYVVVLYHTFLYMVINMIIKTSEYVTSCVSVDTYPNQDEAEFIFLGRSNVGKSSLINTITSRKNLAYTSSKPGKTLTLNFYHINNEFYLIDVPGYGYAMHSVEERLKFGKMIEEYLNHSKNLKECFLIIDSRHKPTEDDVLMFDYLNHLNLKTNIVATKIDKLSRNELTKNIKLIAETLNVDSATILTFSSQTKFGVEKIHNVIEKYLRKEE